MFAEGRNTGIGTHLLNAAENLAKANRFSAMSIQVYSQNAGAVRLYERNGYRLVAREPVRLHPCPPYHTGDVLLLKKPLT